MLPAILFLLALQEVGQNGVVSIDSSYLHGERLDFALTRTALDAAPKWLEFRDDPPLAPRHAIHAAEGVLAKLVDNSGRWRLASVTLRPMLGEDVWVYVVEFDAPFPDGPGAGGGPTATIRIPVLMNGYAVDPTRRPWPKTQLSDSNVYG